MDDSSDGGTTPIVDWVLVSTYHKKEKYKKVILVPPDAGIDDISPFFSFKSLKAVSKKREPLVHYLNSTQSEIHSIVVPVGPDKFGILSMHTGTKYYESFSRISARLLKSVSKTPEKILDEEFVNELYSVLCDPEKIRARFSLSQFPKSKDPKVIPFLDLNSLRLASTISVEKIVLLLNLVLTESKLMFYSKSESKLFYTVTCLEQMMYPFHYECPINPYLPKFDPKVFMAPVSLMFGTTNKDLVELLPKDVYIVLLDDGVILEKKGYGNEERADFPPFVANYLIEGLEKIVSNYTVEDAKKDERSHIYTILTEELGYTEVEQPKRVKYKNKPITIINFFTEDEYQRDLNELKEAAMVESVSASDEFRIFLMRTFSAMLLGFDRFIELGARRRTVRFNLEKFLVFSDHRLSKFLKNFSETMGFSQFLTSAFEDSPSIKHFMEIHRRQFSRLRDSITALVSESIQSTAYLHQGTAWPKRSLELDISEIRFISGPRWYQNLEISKKISLTTRFSLKDVMNVRSPAARRLIDTLMIPYYFVYKHPEEIKSAVLLVLDESVTKRKTVVFLVDRSDYEEVIKKLKAHVMINLKENLADDSIKEIQKHLESSRSVKLSWIKTLQTDNKFLLENLKRITNTGPIKLNTKKILGNYLGSVFTKSNPGVLELPD